MEEEDSAPDVSQDLHPDLEYKFAVTPAFYEYGETKEEAKLSGPSTEGEFLPIHCVGINTDILCCYVVILGFIPAETETLGELPGKVDQVHLLTGKQFSKDSTPNPAQPQPTPEATNGLHSNTAESPSAAPQPGPALVDPDIADTGSGFPDVSTFIFIFYCYG